MMISSAQDGRPMLVAKHRKSDSQREAAQALGQCRWRLTLTKDG